VETTIKQLGLTATGASRRMGLRGALKVAGAGALAVLAAPCVFAQPSIGTLRFSGGLDANDQRYEYPRLLLELALAKAGSTMKVVQVGGMTQTRMATEVSEGRMDLLILPMSWPSNAVIEPLRFPLRRGLLGVRLLLARADRAAALGRVRDLTELRTRHTMGYGADWLDKPAFGPLGFRVVTGASYTGLFDMLRAGRFDFLSRGVNEVFAELDSPTLGRDLALVPGIAMSYPLDDYFFVRLGNRALSELLGQGLARARADGSFDALFQQFHGAAIKRAELQQRRIFDVGGYPVEPGTNLELFDVLRDLPPAARPGR
jgi:ABC-type amino acid transport substrate-binding protein